MSGFSNSVVIMMIGLFVVGGAIFQTGLAKMISSRILKLAGKSEFGYSCLLMLVTSAIGAFVSNTGTVASDASYCGQSGNECQYESERVADAVGVCQ